MQLHKPWPRLNQRLALFLGALCFFLGLLVLIGWHSEYFELTKFHAESAPMQYNTALCFFLFGPGVFFSIYSYEKCAIAVGIFIFSMGFFTLIEYLSNIELGLDLFIKHIFTLYHGDMLKRISPVAAISFIFTGFLLCHLTRKKIPKALFIIEIIFSIIVISLGMIAIFGYMAHLSGAYHWNSTKDVAYQSATGLVILGLGNIFLILSKMSEKSTDISEWAPFFVFFLIAILSALLWRSLNIENEIQISQIIQLKTDSLKNDIAIHMKVYINTINYMAERWTMRPFTSQEEWEHDAQTYVHNEIGYRAIAFLDPEMKIRWIVPEDGNQFFKDNNIIEKNYYQNGFYLLKNTTKSIVITPSFLMQDNQKYFFVYAPIYHKNTLEGFILGIINPNLMLSHLLGKEISEYFYVDIYDKNGQIFSQNNSEEKYKKLFMKSTDINIYNLAWRMYVWPTKSFIEEQKNPTLPNIFLFLGLLLAFLVAALVKLAQVMRKNVVKLRERNRGVELITEMNNALQSCISIKEIFIPLKKYSHKIFDINNGILYLQKNSENLLEAAVSWGNLKNQRKLLTHNDCWALRQNQLHKYIDPETDLPCLHMEHDFLNLAYLCIPMQRQDEILGMLYFELSTDQAEKLDESDFALAIAFAEQFSLALTNQKLRERLQIQSFHDPLTGLYNQRYLHDIVQKEILKAERSHAVFCIIILDIDFFKQINDRYGHKAGDLALQEISRVLQKNIRKSDMAFRYGGEEFVIFLAGVPNKEAAYHRAELLRKAVEALDIQYLDQTLGKITISLGIALFPQHGSTLDELIVAADKVLYQAKQSGRNRSIIANGDTSSLPK